MNYSVEEHSKFDDLYKKARKKYKHSFDDDFNTVIDVIETKISGSLYDQDPRKLPGTVVISGLGAGVQHDVCKTRIYIEDANGKIGRLVWLHDEAEECIYLIDIYHKSQRSNHSNERIRSAYREYCG